MQEWLGAATAKALYDQEHVLLYAYNGGFHYSDIESMPVPERTQWVQRLIEQKEQEKAAAEGSKTDGQSSLLRKPVAGETHGMTPNERVNPQAAHRLAQSDARQQQPPAPRPAVREHRATGGRGMRIRALD